MLCGQGPAPAAASIERYRALGLDLVPGTGLLAACVPGAFDAWLMLLRDYGTWELADVLAYAIGYARDGYPGRPGHRADDRALEPLLAVADVGGAVLPAPEPGDACATRCWRRPTPLWPRSRGATREGRIDAARDAWYRGLVAEAIDALQPGDARRCARRRRPGGVLGDLEAPVTFDFRGWTVFKTGPWGQGPVFLQQLALLDGFDLGTSASAEHLHGVLECAKLAFADREAWYGDARPSR